MCFSGGDDSAKKAAQEQRAREAARRKAISAGTASIDQALSAFNDDYFTGRQQAYIDNAMPSLDNQFEDAQRQLIYALSRGGLLQSSEAANRQRQLAEERARYEREIQNAARAFSNQGRTDVENTRSSLLSQLSATEDPRAAAISAANKAALLNAPPVFDALGNFAFNAAQGLEDLSARTTGGRGFASGITQNISPATGTNSVRYTSAR